MVDEPAVVVLGAAEIAAAVSMADAIAAVRHGFRELARGAFEMPQRTALLDGRFLVMSCGHPSSRSMVVKTLSVNFGRVPSITGTVVRSELDGPAALIADAHPVTTLRTGAAVGVATDLLAAPDAAALVLFGAGSQALDQVRAVHAVRALRRVTVLARDRARLASFVDAVRARFPGLDVRAGADATNALRDADIVCCATPATSPLFDAADLPARVHVNAIGSYRPTMRELSPELLAGADVVVDDRAAVLAEAGEIIDAVGAGVLAPGALVELGTLLTDPAPTGRPPSGRTVFKSVGLAMQDWAILDLLAHRLPRPT